MMECFTDLSMLPYLTHACKVLSSMGMTTQWLPSHKNKLYFVVANKNKNQLLLLTDWYVVDDNFLLLAD